MSAKQIVGIECDCCGKRMQSSIPASITQMRKTILSNGWGTLVTLEGVEDICDGCIAKAKAKADDA